MKIDSLNEKLNSFPSLPVIVIVFATSTVTQGKMHGEILNYFTTLIISLIIWGYVCLLLLMQTFYITSQLEFH